MAPIDPHSDINHNGRMLEIQIFMAAVWPNPNLAFMSFHLLFVSTRFRGPFLGPERVSRVVRGAGMVPAEEGRMSGVRSGLGRRVAVPR